MVGTDRRYPNSDAAGNTTSATYAGDGLRTSATTAANGRLGLDGELRLGPHLVDTEPARGLERVHLRDSDGPLEQVNLSSGAVDYLISDALGSVRGVLSWSGSLDGDNFL